jgi:ParB family chromosome partitioning protein
MVAEVAGETVAAANAKEKGKTLKRIVTDHLEGAGGRLRVERWVPRWVAFPPAAYTERGGVGTVRGARPARRPRTRDTTGTVARTGRAAGGRGTGRSR